MIPRKFHQIWLGKQTMPPEFIKWQKTWASLNPGWPYKLWTEDNLPPSRWPQAIERAHGYSQRSNIYRYEILEQEGGIYVDTDCECLKPIEPLISDCDAFLVKKKKLFAHDVPINSAIMGCIPHHPLFQELVNHIGEINPGEKLSLGSRYLSTCASQHARNHDQRSLKLIPYQLMNPYNSSELDSGKPRKKEEFPDAYILHHWSSVWHPTGFIKLNPSP